MKSSISTAKNIIVTPRILLVNVCPNSLNLIYDRYFYRIQKGIQNNPSNSDNYNTFYMCIAKNNASTIYLFASIIENKTHAVAADIASNRMYFNV